MPILKRTATQTFYLLFSLCFALHSQQEKQQNTFRIDTHIHLYDTNRAGSSVFLDSIKHKKIYHPHLAPEFLEVASPTGVAYAVVVEASKRREDNYWVMDIVNQSENMLAFIGNLDPRDKYYLEDLKRLSQNEKFRGIRIRPSKTIDLSDDKVIDLLGELAKRKLVLELQENIGPIVAIEKIARKYPNMTIIIDHMAGGKFKNDEIVPASWKERLKKLAALPNIYVKISMLYTLSGKSPAPVSSEFYRPFIDQVVDVLGPDRVLFGSNWTLSEMGGSYADLVKVYDDYLEKKEVITPQQFYTDNGIKAFGLQIKK
jgi:predicted TIM-barrel fold metal-dependent hydrolase